MAGGGGAYCRDPVGAGLHQPDDRTDRERRSALFRLICHRAFALGMVDRRRTNDPRQDSVGRELEEEHLPERIRFTRRKPASQEHGCRVMDKETLVYDSGHAPLVGRLWARMRKDRKAHL